MLRRVSQIDPDRWIYSFVQGTCGGRKEGGDVIGRWRVIEMNGRDGYQLKIADRLRSEFQIF